MNIEAERFEITLAPSELIDLTFALHDSIINSVKNHWVNHQNSFGSDHKINMYRDMTYALGRPDMFEDIQKEIQKIFSDHNNAK